MNVYFRLLQYIKPYWKVIVLAFIAMAITAAMEPLIPALMEPLIDGSLINKDPEKLLTVPLLILAVFLIKGLFTYISTVSAQWVAQKAVFDIRVELFKRLNQFSESTHQGITSGILISKITYDVPQIADSLSNAWIVIIKDSLILIGLISFLVYTSWELSLTLVLIAPALSWVISKASKALRSSSTDMQDSMGKMTHILEESINGQKEVKIYAGQEYEQNRFNKISKSLRQQMMQVIKVTAANVPVMQSLTSLAMAIVLYIASIMTVEDKLTPGQFIAFITAMSLLFEPIRRLTNINTDLQKGIAAAQSIFGLLDQPIEKDDGTLELCNPKGEINFKEVDFSYKNEINVLKKFNLNIRAGSTVALVGQSGSGKTTLANLIPRFFQYNSGSITIDGVNIHELKLYNLRKNISYVSQDIVLFNDTVRANIAYGCNAANDDIIQAAKDAYAYEFIQNLPNGFNTQVGQNGSQLSGGQRQRLALARAFLKKAPILILDEATSALDNKSEQYVQKAIKLLSQKTTTIIIAHRLSTIENADNIVVMENGGIIEQGNHQELLVKQSHYARLYQQHSEQDL